MGIGLLALAFVGTFIMADYAGMKVAKAVGNQAQPEQEGDGAQREDNEQEEVK